MRELLDLTATRLSMLALIVRRPGPGSLTVSWIAPALVTLIETIEKALLTPAPAGALPLALVELIVVSDTPPVPVGVPTSTVSPP